MNRKSFILFSLISKLLVFYIIIFVTGVILFNDIKSGKMIYFGLWFSFGCMSGGCFGFYATINFMESLGLISYDTKSCTYKKVIN